MKLIVGLGNPGKKYENTRHNIGFILVDQYLGNIKFSDKFNSLYYKTVINNVDVIFIKPQTFMNLSGDSVIKFVNYFNIKLCDILIIHDDLDMMCGTFKLKSNSSSGGHNGIKSIQSSLNTIDVPRLKVGILNEYKKDTNDFVLGNFSKVEINKILKNNLNNVVDMFISYDFEYTINNYKGIL